MKYSILFISIILFLSTSVSALAQPVHEEVNLAPYTSSSITVNELENPSLQNLLAPSGYQQSEFNFISPPSKSINFSKTTKTLLKIGTSLIRGDNENYPTYSFKDAWKYPGPTVRYPETATEYELFLSRFNRYNPDEN
ncbi:hypothetical protein LQ318_00095 [Aliifodinibius salicampi]|uniref:Sulfatase-modifying factor enzyme 1 n=1 Tax=Fodinibius salicampi TaxID=1920655 RepID=A0ABT3PTW4_9BACT|nr:hypothetical protein [Fodinibius salicampi]MCW9711289.1 hypothetical protein [Fodinibius salicampi]